MRAPIRANKSVRLPTASRGSLYAVKIYFRSCDICHRLAVRVGAVLSVRGTRTSEKLRAVDAIQRLSIVLALAALVAVYAATRAVQFFTQPTEAHAEQVPR